MSETGHNGEIDPRDAQIAHLQAELASRDALLADALTAQQQLQDALGVAQETITRLTDHIGGESTATGLGETAETEAESTHPNILMRSVYGAKDILSDVKDRLTPRRVAALGAVALSAVAVAVGTSEKSPLSTKDAKADVTSSSTTPASSATPSSTTPASSATPNSTIAPKPAGSDPKPKLHVRAEMLKKAENAKTVAEMVHTMHSTPKTAKKNIHAIFDFKQPDKLDHKRGAMNSLLSEYKPGEIGPINAAEAVADAIHSDDAYAAKEYNLLHGIQGNKLPTDVTIKEARKSLEAAMTAKGTTFTIGAKGTFLNHGQKGENIFEAGIIDLQGDKDVFTITTAGGKKLYFKLDGTKEGKLCINILERVEAPSTPTVSTPSAPSHPTTPQQPHHKQPKQPHHKQPHHKQPKQPHQPQQPQQPQQPEQPHQPPKAPEKQDDGKLPGNPNVPADQDHGTTDKPGTAPATPGQSPADVPRQPQDPTPAPAPTSSYPEGGASAPAETGTDTGTTGPATPATGTDQPAPQLPNTPPAS